MIVKAPTAAHTLWLGEPLRLLTPGLYFVRWPLETLHRYSWARTEEARDGRGIPRRYKGSRVCVSEAVYDPPAYKVVTSDRLTIHINIVVHYKIEDLKKAFFNVKDLFASVETRLQTAIWNMASEMTLDEAMVGKVRFYEAIMNEFRDCKEQWGLRITRLDIQDVKPNSSIMKVTQDTIARQLKEDAEFARKQKFHSGEMAELAMTLETEKLKLDATALRKEMARSSEAKFDMSNMKHEEDLAMVKLKAGQARTMHENELTSAIQEMENIRIINRAKADSEAERMKSEAEAAGAGARVKSMMDAGLDKASFTNYIKWQQIGRMAESGSVQFMPQGALDLLGSMKLYRNVADTSREHPVHG